MPKTVSTAERASETITLRLTKEQRRTLLLVAAAEGVTATEVVRRQLQRRAIELGLAPAEGEAALPSLPPPPERASRAPAPIPGSFGGLAARFQATFAERGEGTRRELEATLRFLTEPASGAPAPLLPADLPLAELTPPRLAALRAALLSSPLRLSRKNLHLTYLRMLLNFAVKRREVAADLNPGAALRPLTALEAGESWAPPPVEGAGAD